MVIGAFDPDVARLMAGALSGLEMERAFVIHGAGGWDEPSPLGDFLLLEVRPGRVEESVRSPSELGMPPCEPPDLAGGSPSHNARRLLDVFEGERGAHRDAIVLGAGLALEVTDRAETSSDAVEMAAAAIDDGSGLSLAKKLAEFGLGEARS
jgi:anthranilate phosphoribosyltransferase